MTPTLVGANSALLVSWIVASTNFHSYGNNLLLAQTFLLPATTIFRVCIRSTAVWDTGLDYYCRIYATDVTGKPTGVPISESILPAAGETTSVPSRWRVFTFVDFPQVSAGLYALVISVPDATYPYSYDMRSDFLVPIYPDGKAWYSDDYGLNWVEFPNETFMFQVWGYQPPPPVPPPAEIVNWAPIDLTHTDLTTGFRIVVTTDRKCHLFMRWTDSKPLTHPAYRLQRGIRLMTGLRYCFVAFHENEQLEAGDTLEHTFEKRNWQVCETRWFYFIGSVVAEASPSSSPIFFLHRSADFTPTTFGPQPATLSNRHLHQFSANYGIAHNSAAGIISPFHDPPLMQLYIQDIYIVTYRFRRAYLFFDTSAIPAGSQIVGATLSIYVVNHNRDSLLHPNLYITQGVQNDPIITTDYGAQLPYQVNGGSVDLNDLVNNVYNDIPFNANGFNFINIGGTTRLCIRTEVDVKFIVPALFTDDYAGFHSAQKGAGFWPLLTVEYIPA